MPCMLGLTLCFACKQKQHISLVLSGSLRYLTQCVTQESKLVPATMTVALNSAIARLAIGLSNSVAS